MSDDEGLVAWMREQDALDAGTDDPRLADTDGLRDLDDEAAATGEFEVDQAPSYDPPVLTLVRQRTWSTLYDAATDVITAEMMCMLADITIVYGGPRCSYRVSWYEAPAGYRTDPPAPVLAVEPVDGKMVPRYAPVDRMTATVADVLS